MSRPVLFVAVGLGPHVKRFELSRIKHYIKARIEVLEGNITRLFLGRINIYPRAESGSNPSQSAKVRQR